MRNRTGFSLVELMIVVAIIGILAAIAVPAFNLSQLKAKKAEAFSVVSGIGDAQVAYMVANDAWLECASNPGGSLTKTARSWDTSKTGWKDLAFAPDGPVRCSYVTACQGGSGGTCSGVNSYVKVTATCDVDDNATGGAASQGTANITYAVDNGQKNCCGTNPRGQIVDAIPGVY